MKFMSAKGAVELKFPISGTYQEGSDAAQTIADGTIAHAQALLTTLAGKASDQAKSKTDVGTVCVLEQGDNYTCDTVIDLSEPLVRVEDKDGNQVPVLNHMSRGITQHFRSVGIEYRLATLNTAPAGSSDSTVLKPSKFLITTFGGDAAQVEETLLMWVEVQGSTHGGREPSVENPLVFANRVEEPNVSVCPIPKDYSTSVIISRDVLASLFIKPQLEKAGYTEVATVDKHTEENAEQAKIATGIRFTAKPPNKTVGVAAWDDGDKFNGLSFNLNSSPACFFLDKASSAVNLKYFVPNVGFTHYFWTVTGGLVPVPIHAASEGSVDYTFTAKGEGKWSSDSATSVAASFSLSKSSFDCSTQTTKQEWYEKLFRIKTENMLAGMANLSVDVPAFSLDLGALNFFLVSNLLFPGKKVFSLGKIPDDLYIPRDMLLLGSIGSG
ncbi:hypothetical protein NW762_013659 [Fusarium torreyae]|uniref:Uncharacterized protein n=1 Tax=Fusarium torreyae TaxID=1237075 RepID=A0A9W8RNW9_9HYPO|nr:hypothetical protein NW762_013659 [Fusarium torreyae]